MIRKIHEDNGHFAAKKTQEVIERDFWFLNMKKRVETVISNCVKCILGERKRGKAEGLLNPIDKGETPLQVYHVDHLGPLPTTKKGYKHILVVIDAFTKFAWIYPVKTVTSQETIDKLEMQATTYGNPAKIITDRGSAFISDLFKNYCQDRNVIHIKITTGVPRGNGRVERVNRTMIPVLTKLPMDRPNYWFKHTSKLQKVLNSTHHRCINTTPFQLMFGTAMNNEDDVKLKEIIEMNGYMRSKKKDMYYEIKPNNRLATCKKKIEEFTTEKEKKLKYIKLMT